MDFQQKRFFGKSRRKSEFGLGSAIFGISEVDFLSEGVQIQGVIEKGWILVKKTFCAFVNAKLPRWGNSAAGTIIELLFRSSATVRGGGAA